MHNNSTTKFSWANRLAINQNNQIPDDTNNWPKLTKDKKHSVIFNNQPKTELPPSSSSSSLNYSNTTSSTGEQINPNDTTITKQINSITKAVNNLQLLVVDPKKTPTDKIENANNYDPNRSREEILKERNERKRRQRAEKQLEKYQIKLKNIREPKTDKLNIITSRPISVNDESVMQSSSNQIKTKHNGSNSNTSQSIKIQTNKYKHFKKSNIIKISISDSIINSQNKKLYQLHCKEQKNNFTTPIITKTQNIMNGSSSSNAVLPSKSSDHPSKIKLNKGKHREIPKKKWISHLKRAILLKRLQSKNRRQQFLMVSGKQQENKVDGILVVNDILLSSSIITDTNNDTSVVNTNSEIEQIPSAVEKQETIVKTISENDCTTTTVQKNSSIQHSRKFRTYCNNFLIKELCECTETVLKDLFRFQLRAYTNNNVKGRAKRRYVVGFKETERQLDAGKLRLLIIAPDLEKCIEPGGIDELIERFKVKCDKFNVPYVFSINRHKIGYILLKKVPISCVGIISYDGTEDNVKILLQLIEDERKRYLEMLTK